MKTALLSLFSVAILTFALSSAQAKSPTAESVQQVLDSTVSTISQEEADKKKSEKDEMKDEMKEEMKEEMKDEMKKK
ncbi:hypothetical protein GCM10011332_33110 [Terasakiella brassicae]|uniref:Uncharacterized protein n=1 Tax=Terasakiella brassicae TaxID=1634917 RepID=A0A917C7T1_9PROT|nr:hypothetical protein [Terasakiella brassicae]GGF76479.1 hypothetical protein GCM10011332_33110 [Terasakiella brassicae]